MNFKFSNLLGAPYRGGNILIHGTELLSPVGNKVQIFELSQSKNYVMPMECIYPIRAICISPRGHLLICIDENGGCILINLINKVKLHNFRFRRPVYCLKFSPDGKYIAVGVESRLQIWKCPGLDKVMAPMQLYKTYIPCHSEIIAIDWTNDSSGIVVGSKDLTCRIYSLHEIKEYTPFLLAGFRGNPVGVFFTSTNFKKNSLILREDKANPVELITVASDGYVVEWIFEKNEVTSENKSNSLKILNKRKEIIDDYDEENIFEDEVKTRIYTKRSYNVSLKKKTKNIELLDDWEYANGKWKIYEKNSFKIFPNKVTASDMHKDSGLLAVGFSNGTFEIVQMPGFERLQILSVSKESINALKFNEKGEWLAVGSSKLGQLLVWEWKSETYVLKQQGHHFDITSTDFSPDGSSLATGSDDNKVKVFSLNNGTCYVTFDQHYMPVTSVRFFKSGHALCSASLDGTVRAFDLIRYKNFRVFKSPHPVQFSCLEVDPKGEVVVAGSKDTFQIFVWSIKTTQLLDMLAAHEGPVSELKFSPNQPILASSSWDHTVKIWDVFGTGKPTIETFQHSKEVLTLTYRPDGNQIASATLDGNIYFWEPEEAECQGTIEGRRDIARSSYYSDIRKVNAFSSDAFFESLVYSADGSVLFASGKSKYICIYDVDEKILLKKIQVSYNKGLDGVLDVIHPKLYTDAGPLPLIDDEDSDKEDWKIYPPSQGIETVHGLPGSGWRNKKPAIRTRCLAVSPTGRCFAAATLEGLLIYSLDENRNFDPIDLDDTITPASVHQRLNNNDVLYALLIALRLNDKHLILECIHKTPKDKILLVSRNIPDNSVHVILNILGDALQQSPYLEFLLEWTKGVCIGKHLVLSSPGSSARAALKDLQKAFSKKRDDLSMMIESNIYTCEYLNVVANQKLIKKE